MYPFTLVNSNDNGFLADPVQRTNSSRILILWYAYVERFTGTDIHVYNVRLDKRNRCNNVMHESQANVSGFGSAPLASNPFTNLYNTPRSGLLRPPTGFVLLNKNMEYLRETKEINLVSLIEYRVTKNITIEQRKWRKKKEIAQHSSSRRDDTKSRRKIHFGPRSERINRRANRRQCLRVLNHGAQRSLRGLGR